MNKTSSNTARKQERTWRHILQTAALFRMLLKKTGSSAEQADTDKELRHVTLNQARIFWYIFGKADEEIRIKTLARDLNVSSAAVSQVVDRLVSEELLKREPDPTDRRAVILSIAPQGHAWLEEIDRRSTILQDEILDEIDVPPSDLEAFNRVIAKMHAQMLTRWNAYLDQAHEND